MQQLCPKNKLSLPAHRCVHLGVFVVCASSLLIAFFFMERFLGLAPCPLCVIDRLIVAAIACVALVAAIHNPGIAGQRVYATLGGVFGVLGIGVAWRHIVLQQRAAESLGGCAPELEYLIDSLPLFETLLAAFNSVGDCSDVLWTFAGLTIPQQTLLLFVFLTVACASAALKRPGRPEQSTHAL